MSRIKVLIVDDHSLVREGLSAMLVVQKEIQIVGEASNGKEAIHAIQSHLPDLVLMDIVMPEMNGIEAAKAIKAAYPDVKIILLSMEVNEEFISKGIEAGISGYLPKDTNKSTLVKAIKQVYEGEDYFSEEISDAVFKSFYNKKKRKGMGIIPGSGKLSEREIEVLRLLATGKGNREIADELFISVRTVDAHRNHIMQKLDLKGTADMVRYAIKNNIIEL